MIADVAFWKPALSVSASPTVLTTTCTASPLITASALSFNCKLAATVPFSLPNSRLMIEIGELSFLLVCSTTHWNEGISQGFTLASKETQ